MIVFFYGLFMEEELLIAKNIAPVNKGLAVLSGYALRIGDRATLLPDPAGVCHGVLMDISGHNAAYATHLLKLAEKLGLPQDYLTQIRAFTE